MRREPEHVCGQFGQLQCEVCNPSRPIRMERVQWLKCKCEAHFGTTRLEEGDIVVISVREYLDDHGTILLRRKVEGMFPGHQVIIMPGGGEFGVVRWRESGYDI